MSVRTAGPYLYSGPVLRAEDRPSTGGKSASERPVGGPVRLSPRAGRHLQAARPERPTRVRSGRVICIRARGLTPLRWGTGPRIVVNAESELWTGSAVAIRRYRCSITAGLLHSKCWPAVVRGGVGSGRGRGRRLHRRRLGTRTVRPMVRGLCQAHRLVFGLTDRGRLI